MGGIFSIFTNEKAALFFASPLPKPGEKQNSLMLDNIAPFGEKVKPFFRIQKALKNRGRESLELPLNIENSTLYTPPVRNY
jgi:aminoglycoside/choline kinase family phosphotransferase